MEVFITIVVAILVFLLGVSQSNWAFDNKYDCTETAIVKGHAKCKVYTLKEKQ